MEELPACKRLRLRKARLYEIEIKKLEERDQMKQRLLELRREADEVALEQMRLKKERIAQIRQQQQEVAQGKEGNLQEMYAAS